MPRNLTVLAGQFNTGLAGKGWVFLFFLILFLFFFPSNRRTGKKKTNKNKKMKKRPSVLRALAGNRYQLSFGAVVPDLVEEWP
jgi:hypothetical protein